MDAIRLLRERNRICEAAGCFECPLWQAVLDDDDSVCCNDLLKKPEKYVEIIEKWSNENSPIVKLKEIALELLDKYDVAEYDVINDEYYRDMEGAIKEHKNEIAGYRERIEEASK